MAQPSLHNYLRTYRRRYGLSQAEIAMLLGATSDKKISRHENFARLPAVNTIWGYEVVFSAPARELFAGSYQVVRGGVEARAKRLIKRLSAATPDPRTERKLALLRAIVEPQPNPIAES